MGLRGPKGKYTPEVHAAIIKNLEAGAFRAHACRAVGIHLDTMEDWMLKGDAGIEPYVRFAEDVHAAQARDAVRNQTIITKAAMGAHDGDWKAAAWNLEKKFPKLYGKLAEANVIGDLERPHSPWKQRAAATTDSADARKLDS